MILTSLEVTTALAERRPVVALESTVLAHGLPRPRNLELGLAMEQAVRDGGAVPATVGVIAGVPQVGLSGAEIDRMANSDGVLKLSTRDLAIPIARQSDGATTVASTMWLACRAGVQVFATGGIGGVHRGEDHDISADLTELGRTQMLVVCAGAKSILDLPATREALETAGVLVVGYGTDEFPAFYARRSGLPVDARVDTAEEAAAIWRAHCNLGVPGAMLLCVPPPEEHALSSEDVDSAIAAALESARTEGVRGKEVTPYLLRAVAGHTGGRSLETNVALLLNNARVATEVAVALAAVR
ncbi:pseudouridine-5'-phosphate glycosidase [Longimicrobium terrae]|uniref:Pseudouridine-5'-phosphate glycosidase n=1 Tax=Longimicrobium terrae TaxID=1639882 RepID=A0A841H5F8_9BACT|nr:pseudouridine-5'-phosphate glycosidase [Longimicrobium terrae]MBB4639109.1 pseudouridine-5'-phosphate glycosidase [Longimicrobium terrae]MBB6073290.1 pseudouridine-5'-phosphate glycosidase [Longimicrobium terrae]NNC28731.1 pseudouridine-5'-phosphate glycosidase [Longimicrobium terrae]